MIKKNRNMPISNKISSLSSQSSQKNFSREQEDSSVALSVRSIGNRLSPDFATSSDSQHDADIREFEKYLHPIVIPDKLTYLDYADIDNFLSEQGFSPLVDMAEQIVAVKNSGEHRLTTLSSFVQHSFSGSLSSDIQSTQEPLILKYNGMTLPLEGNDIKNTKALLD